MVDPVQHSLLWPLRNDPSTQIVMAACLVFFDKWLLAKGMHNPG